MHSLSDGSLYPWTTTAMISLLRNKNGKYESVTNARQVKWFSRSTTYAMITLHGKLIFRKRKTPDTSNFLSFSCGHYVIINFKRK